MASWEPDGLTERGGHGVQGDPATPEANTSVGMKHPPRSVSPLEREDELRRDRWDELQRDRWDDQLDPWGYPEHEQESETDER